MTNTKVHYSREEKIDLLRAAMGDLWNAKGIKRVQKDCRERDIQELANLLDPLTFETLKDIAATIKIFSQGKKRA